MKPQSEQNLEKYSQMLCTWARHCHMECLIRHLLISSWIYEKVWSQECQILNLQQTQVRLFPQKEKKLQAHEANIMHKAEQFKSYQPVAAISPLECSSAFSHFADAMSSRCRQKKTWLVIG